MCLFMCDLSMKIVKKAQNISSFELDLRVCEVKICCKNDNNCLANLYFLNVIYNSIIAHDAF